MIRRFKRFCVRWTPRVRIRACVKIESELIRWFYHISAPTGPSTTTIRAHIWPRPVILAALGVQTTDQLVRQRGYDHRGGGRGGCTGSNCCHELPFAPEGLLLPEVIAGDGVWVPGFQTEFPKGAESRLCCSPTPNSEGRVLSEEELATASQIKSSKFPHLHVFCLPWESGTKVMPRMMVHHIASVSGVFLSLGLHRRRQLRQKQRENETIEAA